MLEIIIPKPKFIVLSTVHARLVDVVTGKVRRFDTHNIVTDAGVQFYRKRAYAAAPGDDYFCDSGGEVFDGQIEIWKNVSTSPVANSDRSTLTTAGGTAVGIKAMDSLYPQLDDPDPNNPGRGALILTYKSTFGLGDANDSGLDDVVITNPSPTSNDRILCWLSGLGNITKGGTNTLEIYVNHAFAGA